MYNIPVQNKYEILTNTLKALRKTRKNFECDVCNVIISTKTMLRTHMKVHKIKPTTQENCSYTMSKEYEKMQAETKILKKGVILSLKLLRIAVL